MMVAKAPAIPSPAVVPVQAPAPLALAASRPEPAPLIMAPAYTGQPPGMTPSHGPSAPGSLPAQGFPNRALAPPNAAGGTQGSTAPAPGVLGRAVIATPPPPMLIVNGQVVKEGADLGSGVKLEQITAKSAVLGFRGARYSVGY